MRVAQEGLQHFLYFSKKPTGNVCNFFLWLILNVLCSTVVLQCVLAGFHEA